MQNVRRRRVATHLPRARRHKADRRAREVGRHEESAKADEARQGASLVKESIERRDSFPLAKIKPSPLNARNHSEAQVKQLAGLIKKYGFTSPIIVDEKNEILAGHGRYMAAGYLKLAVVPVVICRGWSEKKKRAYRLADNRVAMNSSWDDDKLRKELRALDESPLDLGFSKSELARLEIPGYLLDDGETKTGQIGALSYSIIIRCKDEAHQLELLEKLSKQKLKVETLIS
jgi:ParB-like chromosome segregation protein Spo0J